MIYCDNLAYFAEGGEFNFRKTGKNSTVNPILHIMLNIRMNTYNITYNWSHLTVKVLTTTTR